MTLDEWVDVEIQLLYKFKAMWRQNQHEKEGFADRDELWPDSMPHCEWDEQYRLWEPTE